MDELTGTGVATEFDTTTTQEDVQTETVQEGASDANAFDSLFPDTPNVEKEKPKPDAHRGVVTSVELKTFDSGATAFLVNVRSQDEGFDDNYAIFLPREYVEDIKVNPQTLSTETPVNADTGKTGLSARQKYARAVRNTDGTGELQVLAALARKQERTPSGPAPTNISELAEWYNVLLSGMEIGFSRNVDKNAENPAFADRLRTKRVWDIAQASDPKFHKKIRRAWEG